jgi:hypothetical protein
MSSLCFVSMSSLLCDPALFHTKLKHLEKIYLLFSIYKYYELSYCTRGGLYCPSCGWPQNFPNPPNPQNDFPLRPQNSPVARYTDADFLIATRFLYSPMQYWYIVLFLKLCILYPNPWSRQNLLRIWCLTVTVKQFIQIETQFYPYWGLKDRVRIFRYSKIMF